jgi:hypothetical protein
MPIKADEKQLLLALIIDRESAPHEGRYVELVENVAEKIGMHWKRAYYLCNKWPFWESGVSLRTGWFNTLAAAKAYLETK